MHSTVDLSSTYYLDRLGRPKCGATHRAISRDVAAGRSPILRRADAVARGVPYGTPAEPSRAPGPPPPLHPSLRKPPPAATHESHETPMNHHVSAPPAPDWAAAPPEPPPEPPHVADVGQAPPQDGPGVAPEVAEVAPPEPPAPELTDEQKALQAAQHAMVFGIAADIYGGILARVAVVGVGEPPRGLTDDERANLMVSLEAVAAHYLPDVDVGPLSGLLLVSLMVGHGMRRDAVKAARERAAREADDATGDGA